MLRKQDIIENEIMNDIDSDKREGTGAYLDEYVL